MTAENFTASLAQADKHELNELSKKLKAISTKVLTKDMINKFSILNGAKCFLQKNLYQLKIQ